MFKLKELRFQAGLTRAELARALKLNQGTLANYENEIRQADYKTLILLSNYFNVSVNYLLGNEKAVPADSAPETDSKPLSIKEKNLVARYRALSEKSKELLYELLIRFCELEQKQ